MSECVGQYPSLPQSSPKIDSVKKDDMLVNERKCGECSDYCADLGCQCWCHQQENCNHGYHFSIVCSRCEWGD